MVAGFLRLNGWAVKFQTEDWIVLSPPAHFEFDHEFTFEIPLKESAVNYKEYMMRIVFSIANMYNLDKWELLEELSKNTIQIREEIKNQEQKLTRMRKLLAYAS
jgi:hypothetical protein